MSLDYILTLIIFSNIFSILTLSLNVLIGYAGQVSLGHAAFFGIGAYTSAILSVKFGFGYWWTLLLSVLISGIVGFLLGLPSLRVRHDFLVLATIGINFVVVSIFKYIDFFGGPYGIIGIPMARIFGIDMSTPQFALYTTIWLIIVVILMVHINRVYLRYGFESIKENEWAAESIGVSVPRFKIYAFAISGAIAGLAGNLWAYQMGMVFPDDFSFPVSVTVLTMLVLGGMGTISGPILGAYLLTFLPEMLRFIQDYRMLLYGLIIVVVMMYQPSGLLGKNGILRGIFKGWKRAEGR